MIKTAYQVPELRNANDEVVQEGAFGKNTALSNAENTGWIDYVMNDLEALHDTIGDSAATLDGNGHVVEPANLAIGDEDGNRLKTSYLKLTGGTVSGTLNVAQNLKFQDNQEDVFGGVYVPSSSATEQYAQFYGGESVSVAGAKLTLYPDGDGRFKLDARSTDGSNTYTLVTDNSGNLNWRGYPLAWKKDYLPLTGGTLSGWLQFSSQSGRIQMNRSSGNDDGDLGIYGGSGYSTGAYLWLNGAGKASQAGYFGLRAVADGSTYKELQGRPDGTLTWGGNSIALSKDVLPLAGGTMTGTIIRRGDTVFCNADDSFTRYSGGSEYTHGASLQLNGESSSSNGRFALMARKSGVGAPALVGDPDGTLQWNSEDVCIGKSDNVPSATAASHSVTPYTVVFRKMHNIFTVAQYISNNAAHAQGTLLMTFNTGYKPIADTRIPFTGYGGAAVYGYVKVSASTGECTIDSINNATTTARICFGGCMWFTK